MALSLRGIHPQAALDLRGAAYMRHFILSDGTVARTKVYAHRRRRSLLVTQISPSNATSLPLVNTGAGGHPISADVHWNVTQQTIGGTQVHVWLGETKEAEITGGVRPTIAVIFPVDAVAVARKALAVITAVRTSLDGPDPVAMALADYEAATRVSPDALYAEHEQEWSALWESGVEVRGRPDVARAINSSLYFLLSSLRKDVAHSVSPGGLASNGYNGHTFWDCETWMCVYTSVCVCW